MCNEDHRHAVLVHDAFEEFENLRLDAHIERRGRLIGDQHPGVDRKGHSDHDPLTHAPTELMRVGTQLLFRTRYSYPLQKINASCMGSAGVKPHVDDKEFFKLTANRPYWIQ